MENIFIRIDELLIDSGKLIVVCGNPYEDVISYLIELANKYNLNLEKEIQGYVPATAIGFSDESLPAVATSILVFNK